MHAKWIIRCSLLAALLAASAGTVTALGAAGASPSGPVIPTVGLMGHWPLNGNANDTSGNGNNGTIVGATSVNGVQGTAYYFNGSAHIDLPNLQFTNSTYTVSIWEETTNPLAVNDFREMIDKTLDTGSPAGSGGPFELVDGGDSNWHQIGPTF